MQTGIVKWFNDAKGDGVIMPDGGGGDLFAHFSEVRKEGFKTLQENQKVQFDVKQGLKANRRRTSRRCMRRASRHQHAIHIFMSGRIHNGEARERLIVWMRRRMAEFGFTPQALADSIQRDLDNAPVYRDAFGNG